MRQQTEEDRSILEKALKSHVGVPYDDRSRLTEIGLDSLAVVRIAVEASPDPDGEIDVSRLADVRTVGELRAWLAELTTGGDTA